MRNTRYVCRCVLKLRNKWQFLLKQIWKMKMRHSLHFDQSKTNKKKKKTIYLVCIVRDNVVHFSFEQWQRRLMTLDDKQWRDQSSISNNSDGKQMTRRTNDPPNKSFLFEWHANGIAVRCRKIQRIWLENIHDRISFNSLHQ